MRFGVAAVVLGAMALSARWVARVPIFQSPDEDIHFDYVVSLATARRLVRAAEKPVQEMAPGGFFHPFNPYSHPFTLHLEARTQAKQLRFRSDVKVVPGYGTRDFFAAIDRSAPKLDRPPFRAPFLVTEYPVGYYALTALWVVAWQPVFSGLVASLFVARSFSVLLLGVGLLAGFGVFRGLGASPGRALLLTAAVGAFPLTSFVSSYVQADNLAFAGGALSLWLALRAARQRPPGRIDLLLAGLALALLQLAKLHVFIAVALPAFALLAVAEGRANASKRRWLEWCLLSIGPSLLAAELQLWIGGGGSGPNLRSIGQASYRWQLMKEVGNSKPMYLVRVVRSALENFLGSDGTTFQTFWGKFGWVDTPLVIVSPPVQKVMTFVLQAGSIAVLLLLTCRALQVFITMVAWWRRGHRARVLQLAVADPLTNALLLFAGMVWGLYVLTNNGFMSQGRNWYAVLPAIFWAAVEVAPRALPSRGLGRWLSRAALGSLLLYGLVGGYWALRAVEDRYYGSSGTPATAATEVFTASTTAASE
jgi:hypothetical protein